MLAPLGSTLGFGGGIVNRAASVATSAYTGDAASTVRISTPRAGRHGGVLAGGAASEVATRERVLVDRPLVREGVSGDAWSVTCLACPCAGVWWRGFSLA
jgi:hypothetical protein